MHPRHLSQRVNGIERILFFSFDIFLGRLSEGVNVFFTVFPGMGTKSA